MFAGQIRICCPLFNLKYWIFSFVLFFAVRRALLNLSQERQILIALKAGWSGDCI